MNYSNLAAILVILVFGVAMYALGRAHRPRTPWQDGYQQGVADTTKAMFKSAVRATTLAKNAAPGRFWLPFTGPRASGRAPVSVVQLKDERTVPVDNPMAKARHAAGDDDDTTVRLRLIRPGTTGTDPNSEAAA
jgi:hypothetical protein